MPRPCGAQEPPARRQCLVRPASQGLAAASAREPFPSASATLPFSFWLSQEGLFGTARRGWDARCCSRRVSPGSTRNSWNASATANPAWTAPVTIAAGSATISASPTQLASTGAETRSQSAARRWHGAMMQPHPPGGFSRRRSGAGSGGASLAVWKCAGLFRAVLMRAAAAASLACDASRAVMRRRRTARRLPLTSVGEGR